MIRSTTRRRNNCEAKVNAKGEIKIHSSHPLKYEPDIYIAKVFAPNGETLNHLPWGDTDPQALKQIGRGVHTRYREAAEILQRSRTWALTPLL